MNTRCYISALSCAFLCALPVGAQVKGSAPPQPLPMKHQASVSQMDAVDVIRQTPVPADQLIEPTGKELASDYVTTPSGKVHKSCVVEVKNGTAVAAHDACKYKSYRSDQTAAVQDKTQPPVYSGWVEASYQYAPSPGWYWYATSAWYVPNNPTTAGSLLYYFPAFENTSSGPTTILQPVMQWGNNGAWGGNYWSMASWWGPDSAGNYHYSTPYVVYTGQIIDGTLNGAQSCTAGGVCTWTITTAVRGGVATALTVRPGYAYNFATPWVTEVYNVSTCRNYPAQGYTAASTNLWLGNQYSVYTGTWGLWYPIGSGTPQCHYTSSYISPNPGATYLMTY